MRNSLSNLQYLLFALLLFALTGCGANSTSNAANSGKSGTVTAKLTVPKAVGKKFANYSAGAATQSRLKVTGPTIPTAVAIFDGTTGGTLDVFPGANLIVTAELLDASGIVVVEGFAANQTVAENAATTVAIQLGYPVNKAENKPCLACHENTKDTDGQNLVANYKQSGHYINTTWTSFPIAGESTLTGCAGCHGNKHADANPAASGRCAVCHITGGLSSSINANHTTYVPGAQNNCASCHSSHNTRGGGCIGCHAIPQDFTAKGNYVNDNSGVRAITGEFSKWSHHVTGRAVTNADCAVCHLEGKASGTGIAIDLAYHMADNKTHLRNGNDTLVANMSKATVGAGGQSEYAWNPANPDHTLMDQFCMSCHNGAGAPTAVAALAGVTQVNPATPRTAINPFGDAVSNSYDQLLRPGVVAVFEQFDTGNTSHHAVRGQRYTVNTFTGAKQTAVFSAISSANNNPDYLAGLAQPTAADITNGGGVSQKNIRFTLTKSSLIAPLVANTANDIDGAAGTLTFGGATTPPYNSPTGFIGTLYETGKFITAYTTLGTSTTISDTTQNHCGDCHSVGQFRAADVNVAPFNKAVIGAHGSNNEYMLRNSNGTDVTTPQALVCFICHADSIYGNFGHEGTNSADADCNGDNYNVAGRVGLARLVPDEDLIDNATFQAELAAGKYAATGGGNIFAIKCINCHNSSDEKRFGGIHGNAKHDGSALNTSYKSYSSSTIGAPGGGINPLVLVDRKPYRFLPGLGNFRYNGGHNEEAWTRKVITNASRQGCYTLTGASTVPKGADSTNPNPAPTSATASGANISVRAIANDNGILGSWGACTDHAGSSYSGAGRSTTRTNLRPLTY